MYESQRKSNKTVKNMPKISPEKSKLLNEAILECIIEDSRPFGDFRKPGMRKFLEKFFPGFVPHHRLTNSKKLKILFKKYKKQLKKTLNSFPFISLTTDVWKRKNGRYFVAITAHFFDDNYNLFSLIIGFRKINGRHLKERLQVFVQNEINQYKIKNKIVSITTDNGADFKSATSSGFGIRFSCLAHNLSLTLKPFCSQKKP